MGGVHWHPMMLLERWAVAVAVGLCLVSVAGAPGQSPASPGSQQNQQNQDTDDAEPAEFHPPAVLGQPAEASPPAQAAPLQAAPVQAPPPPAPLSPPVAVKPPEPPLSTDPVERQLQIDTAHLLQLTEELKAELDKAGNDTLSLAALRKADEVQKLAKDLKERMKDRGQVTQSKP